MVKEKKKKKKAAIALLFLLVLFDGLVCVSAASPSKLVGGLFSSLLSSLLKRLWSLAPSFKSVIPSRSNVKLEKGYNVETVFDGSKLGIEPFSVEVLPDGDFLVLDSASSCVYRISPPLSTYSRPKLVAGSAQGYSGHVDGKPREARVNHPKGLTVDHKGNIYVADTMNKAIRKINDTGVTTLAGGKWNKGAHVDGPSQHAKFSNDFEVVYIGSSCSLLVVDRGYQAIREIQLQSDDCAYQNGAGFPLGIAVYFAAGFLGYLLGMLQRQLGVISSSSSDPMTKRSCSISPYQKPSLSSVRPPLIQPEDNARKLQEEEENLFTSLGKLMSGLGSSTSLIFSRIFNNTKSQHQPRSYSWPLQESFAVPEEEPPPIEAHTPKLRKTYAFMSKDSEKLKQLRLGPFYSSRWNEEQQQQTQQHQFRKHQQSSSNPETYYQPSCEEMGEVMFGAVQEWDRRLGEMEIKAVNDGDTLYDQYGLCYGFNYMHHLDYF